MVARRLFLSCQWASTQSLVHRLYLHMKSSVDDDTYKTYDPWLIRAILRYWMFGSTVVGSLVNMVKKTRIIARAELISALAPLLRQLKGLSLTIERSSMFADWCLCQPETSAHNFPFYQALDITSGRWHHRQSHKAIVNCDSKDCFLPLNFDFMVCLLNLRRSCFALFWIAEKWQPRTTYNARIFWKLSKFWMLDSHDVHGAEILGQMFLSDSFSARTLASKTGFENCGIPARGLQLCD